jgi:hypothetical protein
MLCVMNTTVLRRCCQVGAGELVQRAERLVHEQHIGVDGQHPGDRDALTHASRELVRVLLPEPGKTDHLDELGRTGSALLATGPQIPHAELDVRRRAHPREESRVLEHYPAVWTRFADLSSVHGHGTGGRSQYARDEIEHGRLAAAATTDERDKGVLRHREAHVLQGHASARFLGREAHRHPVQADLRWRPSL